MNQIIVMAITKFKKNLIEYFWNYFTDQNNVLADLLDKI